jgi:hypothetical protein
MNLLLKIVGWKCSCKMTSRVFKDKDGFYLRCLECGRRIAYDWQAMMQVSEPTSATSSISVADALQRRVRYSVGTSP